DVVVYESAGRVLDTLDDSPGLATLRAKCANSLVNIQTRMVEFQQGPQDREARTIWLGDADVRDLLKRLKPRQGFDEFFVVLVINPCNPKHLLNVLFQRACCQEGRDDLCLQVLCILTQLPNPIPKVEISLDHPPKRFQHPPVVVAWSKFAKLLKGNE